MYPMTDAQFSELLEIVDEVLGESTNEFAKRTSGAKWLMRWLFIPQYSFGGKTPYCMFHEGGNFDAVKRLLGSQLSGAYQ